MKQNAINEEDRARFELYAEIYKGIDDVEHGRVKSLDEVREIMKKKFEKRKEEQNAELKV